MNKTTTEPGVCSLKAQFFSLGMTLSVMNGNGAGDLKHI
jgi:hypothetical protein